MGHTRRVRRRTGPWRWGRSEVPKPDLMCLTLQLVSEVVIVLFL